MNPRETLKTAFPLAEISDIRRLHGGLTNLCFRASVDTVGLVVIRFFRHGAQAVENECRALEQAGASGIAPKLLAKGETFCVTSFASGITLRTLLRRNDGSTSAAAFEAVGSALARLSVISSPLGQRIFHGRAAHSYLSRHFSSTACFVRTCAADPLVQTRLSANDTAFFEEVCRRWASILVALERETSLVHGDCSRRNIIVHSERRTWRLSAFIDWELACSGSSLVDIGHVLRYESDAYAAYLERGYVDSGGKLPNGWLMIARLIDAVLLFGALTKKELPQSAALEIAAIVRSTTEVLSVAPIPVA